LLVDQVIEDNGDPKLALGIDVHASVLKHHDASGIFGLVLSGDVDPVIADGAREDAAGPGLLGDFALGYSRLFLGVGAKLVIVGCGNRGNRDHHHERNTDQGETHGSSLWATWPEAPPGWLASTGKGIRRRWPWQCAGSNALGLTS